MKNTVFTLAVALLFATSALAKIIRVPADQPTIQAAINAAAKGDTVLVADGTYYENIDFKGKAITVASHFLVDGDTTHIDNAIIDGSKSSNPNKSSVVSFVSGEDTTSVIYGFTITGGTGTLYDSNNRVGGGIYYENSGARIVHNKITANSIKNTQRCWGGGIGTYPLLRDLHQIIIEDNIIESNAISGNDRTRGGGICLIQGKVIHNKIRSNSCFSTIFTSVGGGIFGYSDTTFHRGLVIIKDNIITHNQVTSTQNSGNGGGVDIQRSNVHLLGNVISHNEISGGVNGYGAGIRLILTKEISLVKDNIISFNLAIKGDCVGGGLYAEVTVGLTIQDNMFEGNECAEGGGLAEILTYGTVISNNTFLNNLSSFFGGGVYELQTVGSIISSNRFDGNTANYNGGGIFIYDCSPAIYNNLIMNNKAIFNGGGIYLGDQSSQAQIINNTIVADTASLYGGGICVNSVSPLVMNTIVWNNVAPNGAQIYKIGGNSQVVYCDIQGDWTGIGNINLNPQLAADSLSDNSPCIGKGIDAFDVGGGVILSCPTKDINGRPRPFPAGSKPDMGAWESMLRTTGVESQPASGIPKDYTLYQNYPNPFSPFGRGILYNPGTAIEFALPRASFVTLKIYNTLGEEVVTLVSEKLPTGAHKRMWEAKGLASGVYLYRLEAGDASASSGQRPSTGLRRTESRGSGRVFVQTKKLILLR